jgi:hypothetical protein
MSNWETSEMRPNAAFWGGMGDAWAQLAKVECRFRRHAEAAERFTKAAECYEKAGNWYEAAWAQGSAEAETGMVEVTA